MTSNIGSFLQAYSRRSQPLRTAALKLTVQVGALGMTCPECSCLNTRSFTYVGSHTVQLVCAECGCIYSVKTIQEIAVLQHGKQA